MLCVKYKVPVVISSLGAVPEVNAAIHSYGGIVLHDVINDRHARSAIRKGADGLIAVAAGPAAMRHALALRADPGNPRMVRRAAGACPGRHRNGGAILAAEAMGAGPCLYRLALHRNARGTGRRCLQADDRRQRRRRYRLFQLFHGFPATT